MPGGLLYTSVDPINVGDYCAPLKMADGSFNVCRFSHTGDERKAALHRANAEFIVRACNAHYELIEAMRPFVTDWADKNGWTDTACRNDRVVDWFGPSDFRRVTAAIAKAEGRSNG